MPRLSNPFRRDRSPFGFVAIAIVALVGGSVFFRTNEAFAADDSISISSAEVSLFVDSDVNGVANIDDYVRVEVIVDNADGGCESVPGMSVSADLRAYGGGASDPLECDTDNGGVGDVWRHFRYITNPGESGIDVGESEALSAVTITATDADEDAPVIMDTTPLSEAMDSIAPTVNANDIVIDSSDCTGTDEFCIIGDTIVVTWNANLDNAGESMGSTPGDVTVDLSNFGGSVYAVMNDSATGADGMAGDGIWSTSLTISAGEIEASNLVSDGMTVFDDAGNLDTCGASDMTVDLDNVRPEVASAEMLDMDGDGFVDAMDLTFSQALQNRAESDNDFDVVNGDDHGTCDSELIDPDGTDALTLTFACDRAYTAVGDLSLTFDDNLNVIDLNGNRLASFTIDAESDPAITDGADPVLVSVSPTDGATSASRTAGLVLTFSEPMDTTFDEGTQFNVSPDVTAWSASGSAGDTVITLSHSTNLGCRDGYDVELDNMAINSAVEETLLTTGPQDMTWSFTTRSCSNGGGITTYYVAPEDATATTDTTATADASASGSSAMDEGFPLLIGSDEDAIDGLTTDSEGRDWAPDSIMTGLSPYDGSTQLISKVLPGELIRSEHYDSVYYVTANMTRRPFWDSQSFFTWANSWGDVVWVSDATLATLTIDHPMLPKPGVVLVKVQSDPKVYAVQANADGSSTLRWVPTEAVAIALYGSAWADYVVDVEATTMHWYGSGADMTATDVIDMGVMKTRMAIAAKVAGL